MRARACAQAPRAQVCSSHAGSGVECIGVSSQLHAARTQQAVGVHVWCACVGWRGGKRGGCAWRGRWTAAEQHLVCNRPSWVCCVAPSCQLWDGVGGVHRGRVEVHTNCKKFGCLCCSPVCAKERTGGVEWRQWGDVPWSGQQCSTTHFTHNVPYRSGQQQTPTPQNAN